MLEESDIFAVSAGWSNNKHNESDWSTFQEEESPVIKEYPKTEKDIKEQEIYLKRLEAAARRLTKKNKKNRETFAQSLQNTHRSINSTCIDVEESSRMVEDDDKQLLAIEIIRSHPFSIDNELSGINNTSSFSFCEECYQWWKQTSCSVS